jgi:hypothetical protein
VVAEHVVEVLADVLARGLAAVEADRDPVGGEERREGVGIARIPRLDEARVQVAGGVVRIGTDARYATTSR